MAYPKTNLDGIIFYSHDPINNVQWYQLSPPLPPQFRIEKINEQMSVC